RTEAESAVIGLQPEQLPGGRLSERRDLGRIPLENLEWARWATGERQGREITAPEQVLKPGDVVYVSPAETGSDDEEAEGEDAAAESDGDEGVYALQQVPEVSGAMVVMDPHTGRVLSLVGGFSYAQSEFNRATQAMR